MFEDESQIFARCTKRADIRVNVDEGFQRVSGLQMLDKHSNMTIILANLSVVKNILQECPVSSFLSTPMLAKDVNAKCGINPCPTKLEAESQLKAKSSRSKASFDSVVWFASFEAISLVEFGLASSLAALAKTGPCMQESKPMYAALMNLCPRVLFPFNSACNLVRLSVDWSDGSSCLKSHPANAGIVPSP